MRKQKYNLYLTAEERRYIFNALLDVGIILNLAIKQQQRETSFSLLRAVINLLSNPLEELTP